MNADLFPRQASIGDGPFLAILELFLGQHLPGLLFKGEWVGPPSHLLALGGYETGL